MSKYDLFLFFFVIFINVGVQVLLKAVEKTIDFEKGLSDRFRAKRGGLRNSNSQTFDEDEYIGISHLLPFFIVFLLLIIREGGVGNGEEEETSGFDPEAIKKRWQVHQSNREKEEEQRQLQQLQKQQEEAQGEPYPLI